MVYGIWNAVAGGDSMPAMQESSGVGTYYTGETPQNALDQSLFTKYSTTGNSTGAGLYNGYAGLNTGFYLTLSQCAAALVQVRIGTGNDLTERDPLSITIEGSNGGDLTTGSSWTLIYSGSTGLANVTDRETFGPYQSISSMGSFASLRFLVTSKRDYSDYVQYSEVEFFGCCNGCCNTQTATQTDTTAQQTETVTGTQQAESVTATQQTETETATTAQQTETVTATQQTETETATTAQQTETVTATQQTETETATTAQQTETITAVPQTETETITTALQSYSTSTVSCKEL
jgi:hypothetical protein